MINVEERFIKYFLFKLADVSANEYARFFKYGSCAIIKKCSNDLYDVYKDKKLMFADVFLFSIAVSLAYALDKNNKDDLCDLIYYERKFAKSVKDMQFYYKSSNYHLYENAAKTAECSLKKIKEKLPIEIFHN